MRTLLSMIFWFFAILLLMALIMNPVTGGVVALGIILLIILKILFR